MNVFCFGIDLSRHVEKKIAFLICFSGGGGKTRNKNRRVPWLRWEKDHGPVGLLGPQESGRAPRGTARWRPGAGPPCPLPHTPPDRSSFPRFGKRSRIGMTLVVERFPPNILVGVINIWVERLEGS